MSRLTVSLNLTRLSWSPSNKAALEPRLFPILQPLRTINKVTIVSYQFNGEQCSSQLGNIQETGSCYRQPLPIRTSSRVEFSNSLPSAYWLTTKSRWIFDLNSTETLQLPCEHRLASVRHLRDTYESRLAGKMAQHKVSSSLYTIQIKDVCSDRAASLRDGQLKHGS